MNNQPWENLQFRKNMITHLKCAIDLLIDAYPLDRCMLLRMFWSDDCLDRRTTQSSRQPVSLQPSHEY